MREKCIKMLLDLGAEDLTKEMHPNKMGKCFLKLQVAKGSYINFNFDYKEYETVHVYCKKRNISEYMKFSDVKMFLIKQGVVVDVPQKFAIFLDELNTRKMGLSLDYEVGDKMEMEDDLPFDNDIYEVVKVQKNEFYNITYYYFKKNR